MMKQVTRVLAIAVLSVTVGCSRNLTPATPPTDTINPIEIASTRDTASLIQSLEAQFNSAFPMIAVSRPSGNHVALLSQLQQGSIDYFISNHLPADNSLWAAPLARDGIAIIANPNNPVTNLSLDNLRRIYQGYSLNWQDLGGMDMPINVLSREAGNSTRLEFERLVMGQQRVSPNVRVLTSIESIMQQIESDAGAIAYLPLSLLPSGYGVMAITDIFPTREAIEHNIYSLRITLYIIGQSEPTGNYRQFVGWVQSANAQTILPSRYIPLP